MVGRWIAPRTDATRRRDHLCLKPDVFSEKVNRKTGSCRSAVRRGSFDPKPCIHCSTVQRLGQWMGISQVLGQSGFGFLVFIQRSSVQGDTPWLWAFVF